MYFNSIYKIVLKNAYYILIVHTKCSKYVENSLVQEEKHPLSENIPLVRYLCCECHFNFNTKTFVLTFIFIRKQRMHYS